MANKEIEIAFFEGPQGAGKTSATAFAERLGYTKYRGIPSGPNLINNTTSQNWQECLAVFENLPNTSSRFAFDRSIWSLVCYSMRNRPEYAEYYYKLGKNMLTRRVGIDEHRLIMITAEAATCLTRANPASPVAILDLASSKREIETYNKLLGWLKRDGFNVYLVVNQDLSQEQFEDKIATHLS